MISPQEHIRIKQVCREKGVDIFSIFTYDHRNTKENSSVKDVIMISSLPVGEILQVAIEYFKAIGYEGKVRLERTKEGSYLAVLSKRLKY